MEVSKMKQYYKEMTKKDAIELATENIINKMNSYEKDLDIAINTELEVAWQLSGHEIAADELDINKIKKEINVEQSDPV
jgi:hypothetical protein